MTAPGPNGHGPGPVAWDEGREVVALILTISAAFIALAPIGFRIIDGQYDRAGFRSALNGAGPTSGLMVLGAAVLVASTPAADVTPRLRTFVFRVAVLVFVIGMFAILDILFSETAGGVRLFFTRFPTIMRFSGPAALCAATAAWLARRVVAFPAG